MCGNESVAVYWGIKQNNKVNIISLFTVPIYFLLENGPKMTITKSAYNCPGLQRCN